MKRLKENLTISILIVVWYVVGTAGFLIPALKPHFQLLTPVGMVMSAFLLMYFHEPRNLKSALTFAGIAFAGFIVEWVGVNTQRLFGHYTYGVALGIQLWNTPLVIGLNWLVLVYSISAVLKKLRSLLYFPLLGALIMTAFDFVMEPVASATGMWIWEGGIIPLKNYIDWFIISVFLFSIIRLLKIECHNRFAGLILLMQTMFFLILNILIRVI